MEEKQTIVHDARTYIFDEWGLPQPTPRDNRVKVWLDESRITKLNAEKAKNNYGLLNSKERADEEKRHQDNIKALGQNLSKTATLGQTGMDNRLARINKLSNMVTSHKVSTIQEALTQFPELKTKAPIIDYLKELGLLLRDEDNGHMVGSTSPMVRNRNGKYQPIVTEFVYYDKDPEQGGVEISRAEYLSLKNELVTRLSKL